LAPAAPLGGNGNGVGVLGPSHDASPLRGRVRHRDPSRGDDALGAARAELAAVRRPDDPVASPPRKASPEPIVRLGDQRAGPGRARPGDTRANGRAPPPRRRGRRGVRGRHSPRHHVEASRADHRWVYGTGRERPPAPRRARGGPYATLEQNTGISTGSRSTRSASPRPVFSQEPEFVRTSTPNDRRRGAPTPCAGARAEIQKCISQKRMWLWA